MFVILNSNIIYFFLNGPWLSCCSETFCLGNLHFVSKGNYLCLSVRKNFFFVDDPDSAKFLLLWSPWELQLRFKARLNQYERQITELVKKGTNIELNTEKNTTTTTKTKTKTDKGPQEPNNWSKSSQPMHISLQSHEHILYQFSNLHSQFFLCSSVTKLFVNKSFFFTLKATVCGKMQLRIFLLELRPNANLYL